MGTPRVITQASDNTKVWEWSNSDPFGANLPNEDPRNSGIAFKYNLRFPGQYYDSETATFYNYFRDYDPTTGRYVQSDPIGLRAGINTYSYVDSKPLGAVDKFGLIRQCLFTDSGPKLPPHLKCCGYLFVCNDYPPTPEPKNFVPAYTVRYVLTCDGKRILWEPRTGFMWLQTPDGSGALIDSVCKQPGCK